MKSRFLYFLLLVVVLTCHLVCAYDIEFNETSYTTNGVAVAEGYVNNIPSGWTYSATASQLTIFANRTGILGVDALMYNFRTIGSGRTGDLWMGADVNIPPEEIVCDNLVGKLIIYVEPPNDKNIDTFQLLATTNNWASFIEIDKPIPIRDEKYDTGKWVTNTVFKTIEGLSQNTSNLKIGVRGTAGGSSFTYGYLHGILVGFKVCATPKAPFLFSSLDSTMELSSEIISGDERGRMGVAIDVLPADKVADLEVWGVLTRYNSDLDSTVAITNRLYYDNGVYFENVDDVLNRKPFDAGEKISLIVFTKYKSNGANVSTFGDPAADGYAYEVSDPVEFHIGQKGSCWVNEFGLTNGTCFVELCGTLNRSYRGGWQLVMKSDTSTNYWEFVAPFDFSTNTVNGVVGIETYEIADWDDLAIDSGTLELRNSAGIVEFSAPISQWPANYRMVGTAKWHGANDQDFSYDWTGTAFDGTFSFRQFDGELSPGKVNRPEQAFLVPVGSKLYFTTLINDGNVTTPLPFAIVTATADGVLNGESGSMDFDGQTSQDTGTAEIPILGFGDGASKVPVSISVSAFAWRCDNIETNILLNVNGGVMYVTNFVSSTVAYDDFLILNEYWKRQSTFKNRTNNEIDWRVSTVQIDGKEESVLQLDTVSATKGDASLTTASFVSLNEKKYLDISFMIRNERNDDNSTCTTNTIIISDTDDFSGPTIESRSLPNRDSNFGREQWYSFREVLKVPNDFASNGKIWIQIQSAASKSMLGIYTMMDKLRVAALDSINVNSFNMTNLPEPTGENYPVEFPSDIELDLTPLTGGIVTNYARNVVGYEVTTNDVAAGTFTTTDAYDAFLATLNEGTVVSTVTNIEQNVVGVQTNLVREVAAELVMTVNDEEIIVPFQFGDGSVTNDIYATESNVVLTIAPSNITSVVNGGLGFMPGDTVKYYARVTYNPDDADKDENGNNKRDVRYYPTPANVVATETGWYAKGDYLPSENNFIVSGPALSCVGESEVTTEGVKFKLHGFAEAGISNLTVNLNGVDYHPFEGLDTNAQVRVTGDFELPTGLAPNTEYTVTITATDVNGNEVTPGTFTFVTLPEAPTAVIEGISPSEVQLTVSGNAAGYVVPADWTQTGPNTWTRGGFNPNSLVTESGIYATNKRGGKSVAVDATPGYTHAAAATKAPTIEKGLTNLVVTADGNYDESVGGNPAGTEYAIRVTTSTGGNAIFSTNNVEVWKTLAEWQQTPETLNAPTIELAATNYFSFVSRSFAGVTTDSQVTTNCWFDMASAFVGGKSDQVADPFGMVLMPFEFFDPAQGDDVVAEVEYQLGQGEWTRAIEPFAVVFDNVIITTNRLWDAWSAVDQTQGTYSYKLRVRIKNQSGTRSSDWKETSGTLDFVPPTLPEITGTPANETTNNASAYNLSATANDTSDLTFHWTINGATFTGASFSGDTDADIDYEVSVYAIDTAGNVSATNYWRWTRDTVKPTVVLSSASLDPFNAAASPWVVTATFSEDVAGLTADRLAVVNGTAAVSGSGSVWTITVTPSGDGYVSVTVNANAATDAAGNGNEVSNTLTRRYDATLPTVVLSSASLDPFNAAASPWVVTATFSEDVAGLTADGLTVVNGTAAVSGSGSVWTITVTPSGDGEVSVTVNANAATDAADNGNQASAALTRIYDVTGPQMPTFTATPEPITRVPEYSVTVTSTDEHSGVSEYFWAVNDGAFVSGGEEWHNVVNVESNYTVYVYAVDGAGNVSATNSCSWLYDITSPSKPEFTSTPREFTNEDSYEFIVTSTDNVSRVSVSYYWSLDGANFVEGGATLVGTNYVEGVYTNWVYSTDEAGNVSETNTWSWTYDITSPTVELSSDKPDYFNQAPMTVTVTFSEPVTNFTAESVYVTNVTDKTAIQVSPLGVATNIYTVTITPKGDGEVSVQIPAGVVADYAGNGNAASSTLTCIYDTVSPTVTLESATPAPPATNNIAVMEQFKVTVTFNEAVTNFTTNSVTCINGIVESLEEAQDPEQTNKVFTVKIKPENEDVTSISVSIAAGTVTDLARNENEASKVLTRNCDVKRPEIVWQKHSLNKTEPTIRFMFSEAVTNYADRAITLENANVRSTTWDEKLRRATVTLVATSDEVKQMTFQIMSDKVHDTAGNGNIASEKLILTKNASDTWDLTKESETPTSSDVEFGKGVCVKVDSETGVTNSVSFTSVDFKPGDVSTFTMSGFAPSTLKEPEEFFHMWFVVCDSLGGEVEYKDVDFVKVDFVKFESGELTVTLPADATQNKGSLFIIGIDNSDNSGN